MTNKDVNDRSSTGQHGNAEKDKSNQVGQQQQSGSNKGQQGNAGSGQSGQQHSGSQHEGTKR
jgi:hypothetical protein